MADIFVEEDHKTTEQEALTHTRKVLDRMSEKMGLTVTWSGNRAAMKGTGIKDAWVQVDAQKVTISITLGLMAKPMKSMIEAKIREKFTVA